MTRLKIDYGIDLGTTNSAIARMENGEPKIVRTDEQRDIIPSCVGFNKKKIILAGDAAERQYRSDKIAALTKDVPTNTFIEFKRTMGTDKVHHSSWMEKEYNSESLSSEVLKKLRSFITDEDFQSVVVTVPAKFDIRQRDATLRAAKLAGFTHCELLQEPIAASMTYGLANKTKNGFWVVFDFGGGTFDAALVKVEDGIMKVIDTEGDNYLGGKNLDYAILEQILIPQITSRFNISSYFDDENKRRLLQEALKVYAEEVKNQLSFKPVHELYYEDVQLNWRDDNGVEIDIDISITEGQLKAVVAPIFQRAIDITEDLLKRNSLTGNKLEALILVGGPTHSPILREMLEKQIKKPDTSANPMTAVAVGAALYASTIDISEEVKEITRDKTKVQLDIGFEASTVELEEWVTLKTIPGKTEGAIPAKVFAEIIRNDKGWSSGMVQVNDKGEIIEVKLLEHKPNSFEVTLYDQSGNRIECQPDTFTIIQGPKMGSATLPCYIGVEVKRRNDGRLVFHGAKGLEINQPLPAKGTLNGLKTQAHVRPGISSDVIKFPIYEGDYYSEGTRAIYNKHVYTVRITGDDLPALLPENSDVDLTLTTDKSGRIERIEAYLLCLEHTVEVKIPPDVGGEVDAAFLKREIDSAEANLDHLSSAGHCDNSELTKLREEIAYLRNHLDQDSSDYDRKNEVQENLKKSLRKIDEITDQSEWPRLESELREEFERLEQANNDLGNEKTAQHVNQLRSQVDDVVRKKDVKVGQALLEEVHHLFFTLTFIYQLIGFVEHHDENFNSYNWKDPQRARQLIQRAQQIISKNPTRESLHPVVIGLIDLLPESERPGDDLEVLTR